MPTDAVLTALNLLDGIAVLVFLASWVVVGILSEARWLKRPSVAVLMDEYRRDWLRHSITRDPRVFDAMIMASLREGTAFFGSACLIAIGGGLALISNLEQVKGIAQDLALGPAPQIVWEIKILLVLLMITNAFLKFVWSNRIFGYCSVMLGSIPNTGEDALTLRRAEQAAELNIVAARAFNRGLRSVYFSLGALAWLLGPIALLAATGLTVGVVLRREFISQSRRILSRPDP